MDIVYPYKQTARSMELRFSLRSLVNLPHDRVFIAGDCPGWVRNITHIYVPQDSGVKAENSLRNILAACARPELSDDFILMNDDFYVMSPQQGVPEYHKGDLDAFVRDFPHRGTYWSLANETNELLKRGLIYPRYFFGIHTPTVLNKRKVLALCERFQGETIMLRTLYHNVFHTPATFRKDVKKHRLSDGLNEPDFLSSSDMVGRSPSFRVFMEQRFPQPCYYETD